ncbi:MAG TPA: xylulokinase [Polyangiaceae bacterium]
MTSTNLTLGIDLGTQSTKVLVYDADERKTLSVTQAPHDIIQKSDGTSEQEAGFWIKALESCLDSTDPALRRSIKAIGVSGQQHGFVPLDASGEPLYRVKLWNDTSTAEECELITKAYGGRDRLIAEVGNPIVPGYTAPKVLWLKRHAPEKYRALAHILLPHDYLNFYLTGKYTMEAGDASGTGWFDVRKRAFAPKVLTAMDAERNLMDCLPELIAPEASAGRIRPDIAKRFGLPETALVSAGGGDNMMAAIGTGCVVDGSFTVSLGTSGTLFAFAAAPVVDPQGLVAAFCSSTGGWLPLVCTMNCTVSTELTRGLLSLPVAELDGLAGSVPAGSDGLLTLPFYSGERTPNLPKARGALLGISPQNFEKAHLVRSAMEGALYALRFGQDGFTELGAKPRQIRLTGGGAKSRVWQQLAADIFGCSVVVPDVAETAAFGGALQALWMLAHANGQSPSMGDVVEAHVPNSGAETLPNAANRARYAETYKSYLEYVELLKPKFV